MPHVMDFLPVTYSLSKRFSFQVSRQPACTAGLWYLEFGIWNFFPPLWNHMESLHHDSENGSSRIEHSKNLKKHKMKKVALLLAGLFMTVSVWAQQQTIYKIPVKKIEVNGSAEIEITPDEIYLSISLKEYYKNKTTKIDISTLEKQLEKAVAEAGLPKESLTIENVYGYNPDYWWKKKKNDPDFLASKRYRLKLNRLDKVNGIMAGVDEEGIESVNIASFSHSKMEEYRKEVKIKALQAAKTKATYLLDAIEERVGGVIEVQEINTDNYSDVRPLAVNYMSKAAGAEMAVADSNIDFKTIKVRAEVRAVFGVK
jgi:uncharacterized protein YggE